MSTKFNVFTSKRNEIRVLPIDDPHHPPGWQLVAVVDGSRWIEQHWFDVMPTRMTKPSLRSQVMTVLSDRSLTVAELAATLDVDCALIRRVINKLRSGDRVKVVDYLSNNVRVYAAGRRCDDAPRPIIEKIRKRKTASVQPDYDRLRRLKGNPFATLF